MIGIHPGCHGNHFVREFNQAAAWMDFGDYQQNYARLNAEVVASRGCDKSVVNSEYAYYLRDADEDGVVDKHNSQRLDVTRHATWDIVMGGGYAVSGFGSTYMGGLRKQMPATWLTIVRPPKSSSMSANSLPSTSQTRAPLPRSTKKGMPPTERNARTGELTPPGMTFRAREYSWLDTVVCMIIASFLFNGRKTVVAAGSRSRKTPPGPLAFSLPFRPYFPI